MSPSPSLRSRLVLGSILWTIGLIFVIHVLSLTLVHRFPRALGLIHIMLLTVILLGLLAAGLAQVRAGLPPLRLLRARLTALREGRAPRVEGGAEGCKCRLHLLVVKGGSGFRLMHG